MNEKCECSELTKYWGAEDRASLCGHIKECPMFYQNFMTTAQIEAEARKSIPKADRER